MCVTEASQPASKQSKQMQANAKQASKAFWLQKIHQYLHRKKPNHTRPIIACFVDVQKPPLSPPLCKTLSSKLSNLCPGKCPDTTHIIIAFHLQLLPLSCKVSSIIHIVDY
jgi:hypothetical protein